MAYVTKDLPRLWAIITRLPEGTYFDIDSDYLDGVASKIKLLCQTQEEVARARKALPGLWKKEYNKQSKWWEYTATCDGVPVVIWGCGQAPKTCTAITQKVKRTKKVATGYTEVEEEVEEIVGWDCGPSVEEGD
jgi:NCAIR mutase (PurE)-related protein